MLINLTNKVDYIDILLYRGYEINSVINNLHHAEFPNIGKGNRLNAIDLI